MAQQAPKQELESRYGFDTLDDNFYLSCQITNNSANAVPQRLTIQQPLPSTLVDKPEDYYLVVQRWTYDAGATMPIMLFQAGTMFVTLGYAGSYADAPLLFPGYDGPALASYGFPANGIFSYQTFAESINQALTTAFAALKVLQPGLPGVAPYVLWNQSTAKYDILFDANYLESVALASRIQLFYNFALFRLFNNYQAKYQDVPPAPGAQYLFRVYSQNGTNTAPIANIPAGLWLMTQEFASPGRLSAYNGVSTLQISSNSLSVRYEYVVPLDVALQTPTSGSATQTSNILVDYVIAGSQDVSSAASYRQNLVYTPVAAYKLTDMLQGQLNNLNFTVTWTDQQGNIYPAMIMPGGSASIKILLERRSLVKNFSQTLKVPTPPSDVHGRGVSRR